VENYFERQFELRYSEMDRFGIATPTTMLKLIEETAADHCRDIDMSLYDLERMNIGWVLLSGIIQMDRYPAYKENITIRTWLSSYSLIKGYRENIIFDEQWNIIGRAKGIWVFFDINRRRPMPILESIKSKWSYCEELSLEQNIVHKIEAIDKASYITEYHVRRFDTDMNKHVNNIRYLQWVIESMPEEYADNYFLHIIDGRFIGEAQYGDTIVSLTEEGPDKDSFIHAVKIQGSNKVCATAKTWWKKK